MPDAAPLDAQFHRAVDLVQRLPKSGPVQTSYEEKLQLYSLYKQATEGDNVAPRPGMLDMLGRAKWDSWAKQTGVSKAEAKSRYVSALLKIFQRFEERDDDAKRWATELEAMGPLAPARGTSPASSESSFHSSRASPPPTHHEHYAPDPSLPPPDVAPNIIPPSALNASHRSLVGLGQPYQYSEPGVPGGTGSFGGPFGPSSRPQSLFGGSTGERDPLAAMRARRAMGQERSGPSSLGFVPESEPANLPPRPASHLSHFAVPQYTSLPQRTPSVPPVPSAFVARDFGTPDIQNMPQPGASPYAQGSPIYPRPTSASTFSHVQMPLNLPATLQQIHTSLQALHERLSTLERTQAALLRRDERKRSWSWFWSSDEDDIDRAELDAEREHWGYPSTTIRVRRKKGLSARVAWALITAVRRAIIGVGASVLVAAIALMFMRGGFRRNMRLAWGRTRVRLVRLLEQS